MSTGAINRVARLPTASGLVDVTIRNSTIDDLRWWNTNMQPVINRDGPAQQRADVDWNWVIFAGGYLDGTATLGRQRFLALTMGVQSATGFIPVGLLCLVLHASHLPDQNQRSVYVLYLADAPRSALTSWLTIAEIPKPIAKALLNVALCEAIARKWEGRLGLYAADEGGTKLFDFYIKRHMHNLPQSTRIPKRLVELKEAPNTGRFFYYVTPNAFIASSELDCWR